MVEANALWYDLPICSRVCFSRCAFFNSNSRFGRLLSQHIHTCVTLHILLIAMIWKMKQGYMVSLCHSMPEGNLSNPIAFELNYVLCHNFPSLFTSFKKHKMKITKKNFFYWNIKHRDHSNQNEHLKTETGEQPGKFIKIATIIYLGNESICCIGLFHVVLCELYNTLCTVYTQNVTCKCYKIYITQGLTNHWSE